jgi:8-oxo-dGTP pyrophosphatase MutT (NUDIX family)
MKKVVRAILITQKREILLGKRARGNGAGRLAFIGGKPELGETMKVAVCREVFEETGALIKPTLWKTSIDSKSDPGIPWKVYYFIAKVEKSDLVQLKPDENTEIVAVTSKTYKDYDIAFNHKKKIKEIYETKSF